MAESPRKSGVFACKIFPENTYKISYSVFAQTDTLGAYMMQDDAQAVTEREKLEDTMANSIARCLVFVARQIYEEEKGTGTPDKNITTYGDAK